uniref:PID domain-containing protein n=1 Tax=Timema cristinae TaxID=61476 RepID=A0A7R9GZX9_TIMCR|nr:unnamed protein product [Timema cristinae]
MDLEGGLLLAGKVAFRGGRKERGRGGVRGDMMRNSTLLKWAHNTNSGGNKQTTGKGAGNRNWIHPPDALQRGHIAYLVKFLGNTEVDQPKGIEVVKEGIRKLKFNQQLRKAEGNKTPKVELTISIDGVAIQEPKTKRIMHQYPLHRISYCADDKGEKRFFSFIAKEADSERHICFVFVSDKLAEEITLTIGQAFDLAYKRFLETSGKDLEVQRRQMLLQQRLKRLETENGVLRQRLTDIAQIKGSHDVEDYLSRHGIPDLLHVPVSSAPSSPDSHSTHSSKENGTSNLLNLSPTTISSNGFMAQPPPVPPRAFEASKPFGEDDFLSDMIPSSQPTVGTKLEGLLLDELEEDFNPRAYEGNSVGVAGIFPASNGSTSSPPLLAPPPKVSRDFSRRTNCQVQNNGTSSSSDPFKDLFGSVPFNPAPPTRAAPLVEPLASDPFGMGSFSHAPAMSDPSQQELENAIGLLDKRILEMKDGFSRGLTFGNEDFSLESLDPLLGGKEGKRCGLSSQPTKVSFRANKNRWITETVDGASYRTGHYEGESLDTPTLNLEEDENMSDDSEATTTQILTAVLKHSDKTVTDPEDSKEEINYENQPELIIDTKDLEMRETSFESSSEVIRDKKEREIVATPVENRPAHWSKTCDEAKAVNKHFSMITSKVDPIKADEACYRQSLGSPLTECKKTKEDEDFLITECQTCSITLKMNKYGVLITCFDCQKLQGDNNCIINKVRGRHLSSVGSVSVHLAKSTGFDS